MARKQYKRREFVKILHNNGFIYIRSSGGHDIYKKEWMTASVPCHPNALICNNYIRKYELKCSKKD